ncbi:epoxyqueuosine reductase QueG [Metabacillus sp. SLBN-84]
MNAAELKQDLIAYSKSIGIDKIGFAQANRF